MSSARNIWNTLGYATGGVCILFALILVFLGYYREGSATGVVGVLLILHADTRQKKTPGTPG